MRQNGMFDAFAKKLRGEISDQTCQLTAENPRKTLHFRPKNWALVCLRKVCTLIGQFIETFEENHIDLYVFDRFRRFKWYGIISELFLSRGKGRDSRVRFLGHVFVNLLL